MVIPEARGVSRGRVDAVAATAFSQTRRDGPDAVRNGSKSEMRPPMASSDGDESRRWRKKVKGRRDALL